MLFAHAHSHGYKDFKGLGWTLVTETNTAEIFAPIAQFKKHDAAGWSGNYGFGIAGQFNHIPLHCCSDCGASESHTSKSPQAISIPT